jgi:hypothetical protein
LTRAISSRSKNKRREAKSWKLGCLVWEGNGLRVVFFRIVGLKQKVFYLAEEKEVIE